jgi:hypothetical protein
MEKEKKIKLLPENILPNQLKLDLFFPKDEEDSQMEDLTEPIVPAANDDTTEPII